MIDEKLISASEVAKLLKVTRTSVDRWDDQGVLTPVLRVGDWRIRVYRLTDVLKFQQGRERRAAAGEAGNGRGPARILEAAKRA